MNRNLTLLVGLVATLLGCEEGRRPHDVPVSVDEIRGEYSVSIRVDGVDGEALTVLVTLGVPELPWVEEGVCPLWDGQEVTLDGTPLEVLEDGGTSHVLGGNAFCHSPQYKLTVTPGIWESQEVLILSIRDDSGVSEFEFENFIRDPRVVLEEPASGEVRRGDEIILRFDPSVDVFHLLDVFQGTLGTGTTWVQVPMEEAAIDHYRARITVPATARTGADVLRFGAGTNPWSGWSVGVPDCSDATECSVRRVVCPASGCATNSVPGGSLDTTHVVVPITVLDGP